MLPTIRKVLIFIDSNLEDELTVERLAQSVKLSRSRLHYLCKAELAMTITRYIRLRRLESARDLLNSTALSVKEVRVRVGMPDRSHFAREFKKNYGLTPSQFRKQAF
jgi:AraC-like DNA-binding protein